MAREHPGTGKHHRTVGADGPGPKIGATAQHPDDAVHAQRQHLHGRRLSRLGLAAQCPGRGGGDSVQGPKVQARQDR